MWIFSKAYYSSVSGMDVVLGSNLPASAGLSSSSALVCCAAVCTLRANTGEDFQKVDRVRKIFDPAVFQRLYEPC